MKNIIKTDRYFVALSEETLDVNAALNFISDPTCGGNSVFLGSTRDLEKLDSRAQSIEGLFYEAYEEMALKQLAKIVQDLMDNQPQLKKVYAVHRLGFVPVCEYSILLAASSPGRQECAEATQVVLGQVKRLLPIWKKVQESKWHWVSKSEAAWLSDEQMPNNAL